jgi:hypothetical protein
MVRVIRIVDHLLGTSNISHHTLPQMVIQSAQAVIWSTRISLSES